MGAPFRSVLPTSIRSILGTTHGPSSALKHKWREQVKKDQKKLIDPEVRARLEREYEYTHGYKARSTWLVPLDWLPEDLTILGQINWIEYVSQKRFESPLEPRTFIFHHQHRTQNRPWIASGMNRYGEVAYAVLGGGYKITAHGIEDDLDDPRDIPDGRTFKTPRLLKKALTGMGKMYGIGYGDDHELDLSDSGLVLAYVRKPRACLFVVPEQP